MNFMVTRPSLACKLIGEGHDLRPIVNPWDPNRTAWQVELTGEIATEIASYYRSIGKAVPGILANFEV